MKILVLQLARLGDIFQTWPVLAALKRQYPSVELHLLARSKFAAAARGMSSIDRLWTLDTHAILEPLVDEKPAIETSLAILEELAGRLREEKFDRVINLSFSPFSSYLTHEVAGENPETKGYTRFSDGYLNIPDDGSAYFYGQVGIGKPNRLHVTDLFAYVAGVELLEADWCSAPQRRDQCAHDDEFVLIHVGASDRGKTLSASKWQQIAKGLLKSWSGTVVLIGSREERAIAAEIVALSVLRRPVNLVGETSLDELVAMVGEARLLIGGDSGPVQIASLVNTPVLNISLPIVSFWETGPRSKGSRILPIANEGEISADEVVDEAVSMLNGAATKQPVVRVPGRTFPYVESRPQAMAFEWDLIRAMYMGDSFPLPPSGLFLTAMKRLADVNLLAIEQIAALRKNATNKTASLILDKVDEIMDQITGMVPEIAPMVRWFRTERLRIGPMPVAPLIEATEIVHKRLADVIGIYLNDEAKPVESAGANAGEAEGDDVILG